jgi:carbamoyltransferase
VFRPREVISVPAPLQFQYDPDIGYRFIPNLKLRIATKSGGYLISTNSLGFRSDREYVVPSAKRQILIFGDSFTAGDGVSNGQRYSDVLENLLGAERAEVHNFGIPGSGTDQQYIAYRKFIENPGDSIVVMAVLVENIRRITSAFRPSGTDSEEVSFIAKPYFELRGGQLVRCHAPVPKGVFTQAELEGRGRIDNGGRFPKLRSLVRSLALQAVAQQLTRYQPTPEYDSSDNPAWLLMKAILLAWRKLIPGPAILFPIPLYQYVEKTASPDAYQTRFAELASEGGFTLHDPLVDLWKYDAAQRREYRDKGHDHPTPAGHRMLAESLVASLRPLLN